MWTESRIQRLKGQSVVIDGVRLRMSADATHLWPGDQDALRTDLLYRLMVLTSIEWEKSQVVNSALFKISAFGYDPSTTTRDLVMWRRFMDVADTTTTAAALQGPETQPQGTYYAANHRWPLIVTPPGIGLLGFMQGAGGGSQSLEADFMVFSSPNPQDLAPFLGNPTAFRGISGPP